MLDASQFSKGHLAVETISNDINTKFKEKTYQLNQDSESLKWWGENFSERRYFEKTDRFNSNRSCNYGFVETHGWKSISEQRF
ncbi:MAG: hypothetical protein ACYS8Y_05365, partial [Planctomycetota bacterium]